MTTPVEKVAAVLEEHYSRIPAPLVIGGLKIDVTEAFLGKEPAADLIIIGDTSRQVPKRLLQTIEGVGRALDMMESRRPLTFVLVGPRPDTSEIAAMSRFARILPIGEQVDDVHVRNWLAVLLPLILPEPRDGAIDAGGALTPQEDDDPLVEILLGKAGEGVDSVAAAFHAALAEPFDDPAPADSEETTQ